MEQLEPSPFTPAASAATDASTPVQRRGTVTAKDQPISSEDSRHPNQSGQLSASVPALRFPRPDGNKQLSHWVSSSSPDIMTTQEGLDASIDELGYELISSDWGSQTGSAASSIDHEQSTSELADDVQSLADTTGTGTDAETNYAETESEGEDDDLDAIQVGSNGNNKNNKNNHNSSSNGNSPTHDQMAHGSNGPSEMETIADRSLEHPTELPIIVESASTVEMVGSQRGGDAADGSGYAQEVQKHQPEQVASQQDDQALPEKTRSPTAALTSSSNANANNNSNNSNNSNNTNNTNNTNNENENETLKALVRFYHTIMTELARQLRIGVTTNLLTAFMVLEIAFIFQFIKHYFGSETQDVVISTVPVACVSSIVIPEIPDPISQPTSTSSSLPTAFITVVPTVSSRPSTASTSTGLQDATTTNLSCAFCRFGKDANTDTSRDSLNRKHHLCSARVHGHHHILLSAPAKQKGFWLKKNAVMISVSRGPNDIPSNQTKVTTSEEGFLIEIPEHEARGTLDVTIATTRTPRIKETHSVHFGGDMLGCAFNAGLQMVMDFAQTLAGAINDTKTWMDETCLCSPLENLSRQMNEKTSSVSSFIKDELRQVHHFVSSLTSQIPDEIKEPINMADAETQFRKAKGELVRQAREFRDELAHTWVDAQINSRLLWLHMRGHGEEYARYQQAATAYMSKQRADAAQARREL